MSKDTEEVCANCMDPLDFTENHTKNYLTNVSASNVTLMLDTIFCRGTTEDHHDQDEYENSYKICRICEDVLQQLHKFCETFSQICRMCEICEEIFHELNKLYETFFQLCHHDSVIYKKYVGILRRRYDHDGTEDTVEFEISGIDEPNAKTTNLHQLQLGSSSVCEFLSLIPSEEVAEQDISFDNADSPSSAGTLIEDINVEMDSDNESSTSYGSNVGQEQLSEQKDLPPCGSSSVSESFLLTPSKDVSEHNTSFENLDSPKIGVLIEDVKFEMDLDSESSINYDIYVEQGHLSDQDKYEDDELMKPYYVIHPDNTSDDKGSEIMLKDNQPKKVRGRPRKALVQRILSQNNQPKRVRGRPRKALVQGILSQNNQPKRVRGRPRKALEQGILLQNNQPKRIRGRPRKALVQGILLEDKDNQPERDRGRARKSKALKEAEEGLGSRRLLHVVQEITNKIQETVLPTVTGVKQGIASETQETVLPRGEKRGRGRPRKDKTRTLNVEVANETVASYVGDKQGITKETQETILSTEEKRDRGRLRKVGPLKLRIKEVKTSTSNVPRIMKRKVPHPPMSKILEALCRISAQVIKLENVPELHYPKETKPAEKLKRRIPTIEIPTMKLERRILRKSTHIGTTVSRLRLLKRVRGDNGSMKVERFYSKEIKKINQNL